MARSRKFFTVGAIGVAAIALIGAGAGATFTGDVSAAQSITAGTLAVSITSANGTTTNNGATLTLNAYGPASSIFTTGASVVNLTNTGNIPATEVKLAASAVTNGPAGDVLKNETYVKIVSSGATFFNGPLSQLITGGSYDLANGTLPDSFTVEFYARDGVESGTDGHGSAPAPFTAASLLNSAQGGQVVPTITITVTG